MTLAKQLLPQMESENRAKALRSLWRTIDEKFFNMTLGDQLDRPVTACPRCGSWHVVKKGRDGAGTEIDECYLRESFKDNK